jgi:hypothetical protein
MQLTRSKLGYLVAIKKAYLFNKPYYIVATNSDDVATDIEQFEYDHAMRFGVYANYLVGSKKVGFRTMGMKFFDYRHARIFRNKFLNAYSVGGV